MIPRKLESVPLWVQSKTDAGSAYVPCVTQCYSKHAVRHICTKEYWASVGSHTNPRMPGKLSLHQPGLGSARA